ncbi:MAG: zinc-dependent metalloprotease [Bacteroidota bacterium]
MKQILTLILTLLTCLPLIKAQHTIEKCGTEHLFQQYAERHPEAFGRRAAMEAFTQQWIAEHQYDLAARNDSLITIPLVVHILRHPDQDIYFSDYQIQAQIASLNADFQMRNLNQNIIPDEFRPFQSNINFEFCLASFSPDGQPTSGINRVTTEIPEIGNFRLAVDQRGNFRLFRSDLGGQDAWDPAHYLNVWVADTGNAFLGYGVRPGELEPHEDGIIVDTRYFASSCQDDTPHLGKTMTHEVGHYFNLQHPWGSAMNCDSDDGVSDTPRQERDYTGCPVYPVASCGSNDMFVNFMDYSDDACLAMFTEGQRMRMLAALNGPRASLLSSNGCGLLRPDPTEQLTVFPNPATNCIHIDLDTEEEALANVRLLDAAGRMVYESNDLPRNILSIYTEGLSRGMYIVQVRVRQTTYSTKVIVMN